MCFSQDTGTDASDIALYICQASAPIERLQAPAHRCFSPKMKILPISQKIGMEPTSVIEIPMETSISPGSAMLGSWPMLLRKQFIAIKNLFRPSRRIRSSCTQDPRCTSFSESSVASTGVQLLTTAGTRVENPKPTGYQPSRNLFVKATLVSCGL
jgi:hypothetical protein